MSDARPAAPAPMKPRPMSPHLLIYRPQVTSMMSIGHRATGIVNTLGLMLLVVWVASVAAGGDTFDAVHGLLGSMFGYVILFGWTVTVFYHLSNGIRHMIWDAGYAMDLPEVYASAAIVAGSAVLLSAVTWIVALVVLL